MTQQSVFRDVKRMIQTSADNLFYGILLSKLTKYEDPSIPTARVILNPVYLTYELIVNPEWYYGYPEESRFEVLKHEAIHAMHNHPITMQAQMREDNLCIQLAMDLEINQYLDHKLLPGVATLDKFPEIFKVPADEKKGSLYYYKKLRAYRQANQKQDLEEFFKSLDEVMETEEMLSPVEQEVVITKITQTIQEAIDMTGKLQGSVPGFAQELVNLNLDHRFKISWKTLINRSVQAATSRYRVTSKYRPSRRFEDAQGFRKKRHSRVLFITDTSGSMDSKTDLNEALNHMYFLKKTGIEFDTIDADTQVVGDSRSSKKMSFDHYEFTGRGGTDFNFAIDYANKHKERYACFIYITDGYANPLRVVPQRQLIWLLTENGVAANNFNNPGKIIKMSKL